MASVHVPCAMDTQEGKVNSATVSDHAYHQIHHLEEALSDQPKQSLTESADTAMRTDTVRVVPIAESRMKTYAPQGSSSLWQPLTHPNGTPIFPDLSSFQQATLSADALLQAQDRIQPDDQFPIDETDDDSTDARMSPIPTDSGYESDAMGSDTTSVSTSVHDFMYENGRRYHRFREGRYSFPNDETEQEREDMKHAMVKLLCHQQLHFAPVKHGIQHVLDMGTGTGIWAIEMGDQYPGADILGVDLSPIQPEWLPHNVQFLVDDVESPWLYPKNHFDYIHSRHTAMAIKNWRQLLLRSFEHIKPGGWFELQEVRHCPMFGGNQQVPLSHPVAQYWSHIHEGLTALGVDINIVASGALTSMMRDAGFVNVTEKVVQIPLGTWPENDLLKTVGLYWRTILVDGLQAISLGPMTRGLHWSREEVEMYLVQAREAYLDDTKNMHMPLHIFCGQKPT